jgi:hypothetical protein
LEENVNDQIVKLEAKKKSLYKKLKKLGNFRRGTISVHYRKCGKKNCACAKSGHPGHGPQYLWTTTIKKKSYSKNLKMGPELQKYKEETENYLTFMQLYKEFIHVNEEICNLLPPAELNHKEEEALKKKLQKYFRQKLKKK